MCGESLRAPLHSSLLPSFSGQNTDILCSKNAVSSPAVVGDVVYKVSIFLIKQWTGLRSDLCGLQTLGHILRLHFSRN